MAKVFADQERDIGDQIVTLVNQARQNYQELEQRLAQVTIERDEANRRLDEVLVYAQLRHKSQLIYISGRVPEGWRWCGGYFKKVAPEEAKKKFVDAMATHECDPNDKLKDGVSDLVGRVTE